MKVWRVYFVFFLFAGAAAVIVWRLYSLQIKHGDRNEALALGQYLSFREVRGERGDIFFRDGKTVLAQNQKKQLVYISPEKISQVEIEKIIDALVEVFGEEKEKIISALQKNRLIKREVAEERVKKLLEKPIRGIYLDNVLARFYPKKEFAAHVLGFVNEEGKGQYGIEGYYDEVLRGVDGLQKKGKSPYGYLASFFESPNEEILRKGADIYLTLDYNIQYFAEKLLNQAKEKWDIDAGQIIVTEPGTGKILAMAVLPTFNPNNYATQQNLETFLNGSIQKLFEPGSVFKAITMAAGIEEGLVAPETTYQDQGFVDAGGPPIYNFQKRVWGEQTMTDVLEESINTGAVFVQQKLGKDLFLKYLGKFGFFEKTGVDLQAEVFSANENLRNGYPRDFASASFGQGIQATAMQLVMAFGSLANNGKLMKPYLVDKIVKSNGEVVKTNPQIKREVISKATSAKITAMLVSVVEQGSGRRAKIPGYYIAGKTGTAQVPLQKGGYSEDKTIQSFIGYFPALSPQVLILVKLDNPKGVFEASRCAVPLFRDLAKYIIDLWGIPPLER